MVIVVVMVVMLMRVLAVEIAMAAVVPVDPDGDRVDNLAPGPIHNRCPSNLARRNRVDPRY